MEQPQNKGSTRYTLEYCKGKKIAIECSNQQEWEKCCEITNKPYKDRWGKKRYDGNSYTTLTMDSTYDCKNYHERNNYTIIPASQFLQDNGQQVDDIQVGDWVYIINGGCRTGPGIQGDKLIGNVYQIEEVLGESVEKWKYKLKGSPANSTGIRYSTGGDRDKFIRKALPHEIPQTDTESTIKVGDRIRRTICPGGNISIGDEGKVMSIHSQGTMLVVQWDKGNQTGCDKKYAEKLSSGIQLEQDTGSVVEGKWYVKAIENSVPGHWWQKGDELEWIDNEDNTGRWYNVKDGNQIRPVLQSEFSKPYQKPHQPDNIPVTADNAVVGMRVVRGKDWRYDNQDSGKDGEIIDDSGYWPSSKKDQYQWVKVKWNNDRIYSYRIGYEEKYDLYIAPSNAITKQSNNNNQSQTKTNNNVNSNNKQERSQTTESDKQQPENSEYQACRYQLRTNPKGAQGQWEGGRETTPAVYKVKPKISQALYRED